MSDIIETLRRDGIWRSPTLFPYAKEFLAHLKGQPSFPGHVLRAGDEKARPLDECLAIPIDQPSPFENEFHFACHHPISAMSAPGLLNFLFPIFDLAEEYFDGEVARLYSVNSFWKKPRGLPGWHYDTDDRKILAFFMYGTDILAMEDGPHGYVKGSQHWGEEEKNRYHNTNVEPPQENAEILYGPAGTWFLTDTRGLHNGFCPAADRPARLLTWARWGVSLPPISYIHDKLSPVPVSALSLNHLPEKLKLVVQFNA